MEKFMSLVLFEKIPFQNNSSRFIGKITLNSESTLNSLSLEMIDVASKTLREWKTDPTIRMLFLQGAGSKAFCAGGDIKKLYESMIHKNSYAGEFFEKEYRLDYALHTFGKPIIAWGHGIVMGGGMGLFQAASHRVVTEKTMMAMPEISIGLYPDVGATFFLKNCPNYSGLFFALTGARIIAAEAIELKMADYFIESLSYNDLIAALSKLPISDDSNNLHWEINQILLKFQKSSLSAKPASQIDWNFVDASVKQKSSQEFENFLLESCDLSSWCEKAKNNYLKGSPTSAAIIFEQFKRGKNLSLKDAFKMEWIISVQCALHSDFKEGVRALLIDKDNKANWQPAKFSQVSQNLIDEHFILPKNLSEHPLENL
jgi:enoyl-CoA hydratase/carnithine racemase